MALAGGNVQFVRFSRELRYLSEVVEVVFLIDPMITEAFVDAIDLCNDVADIRALAVIHHTLEQLSSSTKRRNVFTGEIMLLLFNSIAGSKPMNTNTMDIKHTKTY